MRQNRTLAVTAVSLGVLLAPPTFAQYTMEDEGGSSAAANQENEPPFSAKQQTAEKPRILKTSEIIGYSVISTDGEELGTIQEIVIDPHEDRVAYAVLSFGGFLGMGDKLIALPWEALLLKPDKQTAFLSIEKEKLRNAPGFDQAHWPDMASREWGKTVHNYYGQTPYWEKDGARSTSSSDTADSPAEDAVPGAPGTDRATDIDSLMAPPEPE